MPIYRFRCSVCREDEEVILPMAERGNPRIHCGIEMRRVLEVPAPAITPMTGRDISLKTLNGEDGHDFPTREGDRQRMEMALAKGLDQKPPTTGRGYGGGVKVS